MLDTYLRAASGSYGARALVTDLVVDPATERHVVYLGAFGPSEEVRALGQLVAKGCELHVDGPGDESAETTAQHRFYAARSVPNGKTRVVPAESHYAALVVTPSDQWIVAEDDEACFAIFRRLVDAEHLVHPDWHRWLFSTLEPFAATVGTKRCVHMNLDVELAVMEGLRDGHIHFPSPEAHVLVPLKDEENADSPTPPDDNIQTAEAA